MKFKKLAGVALAFVAAISLASCGGKTDNGPLTPKPTGLGWRDPEVYTYKSYTSVSPSNWNELTYQDENDTQIMQWLGSSFFSFDFLCDTDGNILPGQYAVVYSAATKLEDVTEKYAGDAKYAVPEDAKKNYAYKITLRDDLKWDDGTPIKAEDFVYSMQQQLDPAFKNYRADSYYNGSLVIHNAKDYVYQGDSGWYPATTPYSDYSEDMDSKLVFTLGGTEENNGGNPAKSYFRDWLEGQLGTSAFSAAVAYNVLVGNFPIDDAFTAEAAAAMEGMTLAEIKADATLKAAWEALLGWWQTDPGEELHFFITEYTWPSVDFSNVGIKVGDKANELVVILDNSLALFKDDGSLSYRAPYNLSSLPLVHKAKYEASKQAPSSANALWTSTYNSSVESTASWGPYKLTDFQAGKYYRLERNNNWYGFSDKNKQYDGQYQTDIIECETIKEYETALLKFLSGDIMSIGIDVTVANTYKNSEQAIFTPDDFVSSIQLQSSKEALAGRETDGINKTLLSYDDFRKALAIGFDRDDYARRCTTSSLAGLGLFNSMHYYDVENGGVYRDTDYAKRVLCEVYAVDPNDFASLDDAVESITGYNVTEARKLVDKAYDAAIAAGDLKATDKVKLTVGSGAITISSQRTFDWFEAAWTELMKGTKLEGKFEMEFVDKGTKWATDFRDGAYDIILGGGWSGAAWDPGYMLLAYLSPDYMYSAAWDTSSETMTFTMKGVGENGADVTETMNLLDWYDCLNGASGAKYNWAQGEIDDDIRCSLIAALEGAILKKYYSVPIAYSYGSSLLSYKADYITREYNTFMAYGGLRYMTYHYTDAAWSEYVSSQGGSLDYTH